MIKVRKSEDRGHANHGWLNTYHTFSFADFYDPKFMGFRTLRVINEDRVKPGAGFGTHGHRDMEIISYVLEGALEHKDSIGTGSVMRPGDVQRMSAGTGIRHSEFNHSKDEPVHFLQIWLLPEQEGLPPSYEQKAFSNADKRGQLRLIASRDGRNGSVTVHQDAEIFAAILNRSESVSYALPNGRKAWVQVARGAVTLNGKNLTAGDGSGVEEVATLEIRGVSDDSEILLFNLA